MIALSIALVFWAGAFAYAIRCWKRVRIAEMDLARTLSNNNRATAERLERATHRFYEQLRSGEVRSDNLRPPGEVVRPEFGRKLRDVADEPGPPEGVA